MEKVNLEIKHNFIKKAQQSFIEAEPYFFMLEKKSKAPSAIENIFYLTHHLKNIAKVIGCNKIQTLTHEKELILLKIKSGEEPLNPFTISNLLNLKEKINHQIDHLMVQTEKEKAKKSPTKTRKVSLKKLFKDIEIATQKTLQNSHKKIEIEFLVSENKIHPNTAKHLQKPLLHILRHAIDYGIESPSERKASGKPSLGHIQVAAYPCQKDIIIEIADDGKGLDATKIEKLAKQKNLIPANVHLTPQAAHQLIFLPDFSNLEKGDGMSLVKNTIEEELGGNIHFSTVVGKGSCLQIRLPV